MIGNPSAATHPIWPDSYGIDITCEGPRAIVAVRGDLDAVTAPALRTILVGLADGGQTRIVLDLSGLSFMGAAGLGVIVAALSRLKAVDGSLVLRSAPALTLRLLHVTGLIGRVTFESAEVNGELVRVAARPARDRAIDQLLALVVAIADVTVDGADGVSVTLRRNGRLATVASTNETILRMDAHQYDTHEGPCLSAASQGEAFHSESLADEARWPAFVPLALDEGIASILSTPLLHGGGAIGALNIYSSAASVFGPIQIELAAVLAGQASRVLTDPSTERSDADISERLGAALRSRLVLAQAQGILMARGRMSAVDATAALHRAARAVEQSVLDHAASVVRSTDPESDPTAGLGHG